MDQTEGRGDLRPAAVLGLCLMVGLILGGWLLGGQIKAMKLGDRYVTVKGLVERTVKSDAAIWPVSFKEAGADLAQVFAKSEIDKQAVLKFLSEQGVTQQEIAVGQIQVTDKLANEYGGLNTSPRYIVQQTVMVTSSDVDKLARAGQKMSELVRMGVVVGSGSGQGVKFLFNGLNILKPDMITEATRNARASADRFAADSGSRVGSIRSANQGLFSISAANGSSPVVVAEDEGGSGMPNVDASIAKKVRVVVSVEYYLVK